MECFIVKTTVCFIYLSSHMRSCDHYKKTDCIFNSVKIITLYGDRLHFQFCCKILNPWLLDNTVRNHRRHKIKTLLLKF